MTPEQEHALQYNDPLQDWLDGDLASADARAFEAHLAGCAICQGQLEKFERLDDSLREALPKPALDRTFDERLFAQIGSFDEAQRAAARARAEQELQRNLEALSRSWRRMLAFIVPGVLAGIAFAFALAGYFFTSDFSADVAQGVAEGASAVNADSDIVHLLLTTLLGAGIGAAVAGWLARVAAEYRT